MQQAKYFKDQICDELKGAVCYLKKAIDWIKIRPDWAEKFYTMAEAEEKHATELYKMFMQMYSESQGIDSYMSQMRDIIMDCFSTEMRKIEDCKSTYSIMTSTKNEPVTNSTLVMSQKGSII